MILEKVLLRNFRTYSNLRLEPRPGLNVLHGPNASGKTNFLEAIHVAATGRSPRAFQDHEMIAFGEDAFLIRAQVRAPAGLQTLEVTYGADKGKAVRINGNPPPSLHALAGRLPVVFFSPDEIATIGGPPARRRTFVDQLLCQGIPTYTHHLERYRAVLEQYNVTLRDFRAGRSSDALLPIWEEQLASHGGELLARRLVAVSELNTLFESAFRHLYGSGGVRLVYRPAGEGDPPPPGNPPAASAWIGAALGAGRVAALDRGFPLAGPHRDDLSVEIEGMDARHFASQGQRRALTLALKLAAAGWLEGSAGAKPVLLLDDVFSELDGERRERLLALLGGGYQVFATCTGPEGVQEIMPAQGSYYSVGRGVIFPVQVNPGRE